MRFSLHYRGPLHANGSRDHKHSLRRAFHLQLRQVWAGEALQGHRKLLGPKESPGNFSNLRTLGSLEFAPLVTEEMFTVADLDVSLLRPGPVGRIVGPGGDIDNRLKSLFDALGMPPHSNQLPDVVSQSADEKPFFVLLEDDKLIASVAVRADTLLEPVQSDAEVDLVIRVRIRATVAKFGNQMFGR